MYHSSSYRKVVGKLENLGTVRRRSKFVLMYGVVEQLIQHGSDYIILPLM